MNREEIKNILPHREPMLLLDEVRLENGDEAVGKIAVKGDEFFLQGHFPGNPVVPGVILCEMMGQTCCALFGETVQEEGLNTYFTGLDKVKFRRPVRPGDVVETRCRVTRSKGPFHFAEGTVTVDGQLAASAHFSFALTKDNA